MSQKKNNEHEKEQEKLLKKLLTRTGCVYIRQKIEISE